MNTVAIIVYGEYREFEIAQKSWDFLKTMDSDFYFSTWDISNQDETIEKQIISEDMIKKYFPNA